MTVIVMKMLNGEEVIAEESNPQIDTNSYYVDRPRVINIAQTKDGKGSLGLFPYLLSDPERKNVPINMNTVVTIFESPRDLAKAYSSAVSGIALV